MVVADEKDAVGSEQACHRARPACELGQPLKRSRPGDDDVELPVDNIGRMPGVTFDKGGVGACPLDYLSRELKRDGREVQPPNLGRAEALPAERVRPDVALQVQNGTAGKSLRPKVGEKDLEVAVGNGRDVAVVGHQPLHLVKRGYRMHPRPVIPVVAVLGDPALGLCVHALLRFSHLDFSL